ncbi:hypothetical protein [uncultured Limosilactobacillus sp.]|uniref:hypothetical protein n=1 Tax=uncultured Limosilactobacillus sp. TaxID=2837629 RepID=UPI0025DCBA72|nr:hypothetical protein [uncultured Limosilactobacillus sp.]
MEVQLVQFHIELNYGNIQMPHGPQGINLEFLAVDKYVAINQQGIPQFKEAYGEKLTAIIKKFEEFCGFQLKQAPDVHPTPSFHRLEIYNDLLKYIVNLIQDQFNVANEMELIDVHLIGDFSVYQGGQATSLQKEANRLRVASIQATQQRLMALKGQANQAKTN